MADTAKDIAARLTKAQRENWLLADIDDPYCRHCSAVYWEFPQCISAYAMHHNPDCRPEDDGGTEWTWEPLGLKVRALLMEQDNAQD